MSFLTIQVGNMAMGQNPVPPVNIPIPTKIGSKMDGASQNGTIGFEPWPNVDVYTNRCSLGANRAFDPWPFTLNRSLGFSSPARAPRSAPALHPRRPRRAPPWPSAAPPAAPLRGQRPMGQVRWILGMCLSSSHLVLVSTETAPICT